MPKRAPCQWALVGLYMAHGLTPPPPRRLQRSSDSSERRWDMLDADTTGPHLMIRLQRDPCISTNHLQFYVSKPTNTHGPLTGLQRMIKHKLKLTTVGSSVVVALRPCVVSTVQRPGQGPSCSCHRSCSRMLWAARMMAMMSVELCVRPLPLPLGDRRP